MKKILLVTCLLFSIPVWAQEFLRPGDWCGNKDKPLPDFVYRFECDEFHNPTGDLVWDNDTIAFAEYRHYEFYKLYVMKVPQQWVRALEELADAATMTANHFVGDLWGVSLSFLYSPRGAAMNSSPTYGRAFQLDSLMYSIITHVMQNDSASLYKDIMEADSLTCSFRGEYPLSWYRPSVGIGYAAYRCQGKPDLDAIKQEQKKRFLWMTPLTEQHDLFLSSSISSDAPSMFLNGRYLKVIQRCDCEVDSVMINQFALDHREEFVQLSRTLFVDGYEPKMEITLSDTVTQRHCEVDEWHCRMLLPSTDRLSEVVPPKGQGTFLGDSPQSWHVKQKR